MRTTIVILTFLFCSCSTDKKSDNNNVFTQTNVVTSLDTTTKKIIYHSGPIPLTIFPGQGINNIKLGISNYSDILDLNIKFEVDSGEGIACGETSCRNFWKRYYNEESGLLMEYSSECFPEPNIPKTYTRKLYKITIQDNKLASLKNGLSIGTSTYSQIAKIYGPIPKDWKNESYLRFDEKGISFRFDNNSKLYEIEIFKPDK